MAKRKLDINKIAMAAAGGAGGAIVRAASAKFLPNNFRQYAGFSPILVGGILEYMGGPKMAGLGAGMIAAGAAELTSEKVVPMLKLDGLMVYPQLQGNMEEVYALDQTLDQLTDVPVNDALIMNGPGDTPAHWDYMSEQRM